MRPNVLRNKNQIKASKPSKFLQEEMRTSADSSLLILFNKGVEELRSRNNTGAVAYFQEIEKTVDEKELKNYGLLYRYKVNYGVALIRIGKFRDAISYLNSAEKISKLYFGKADGKLVPIYINIGNSYVNLKDNLKAQKYYEAALFIIEQNPSASRWRARLINNLGLVAKNNKDYNNALKYLLEGLQIKKDRGVVDLSSSLNNIGNCYKDLGYDTEADTYIKSSIEESIKINGEGNSDLANFYLNYAVFQSDKGNNMISIEFLNKSYKIYIDEFGLKHRYGSLFKKHWRLIF